MREEEGELTEVCGLDTKNLKVVSCECGFTCTEVVHSSHDGDLAFNT